MAKYLIIFTLLALTKKTYQKATLDKTLNHYTHLQYEGIRRVCDNRGLICDSDMNSVCTVRMNKDSLEYKDYENSCYAAIGNMCEYPDNEFHIITSGSCDYFLLTRRNGKDGGIAAGTTMVYNLNSSHSGENSSYSDEYSSDNGTEYSSYSDSNENATNRPDLRTYKVKIKYDIETAYDDHDCPYFCTDIYDPYCVTVNRGNGMFFKYYTFLNHCRGDMYYCGHWKEFQPPPDENEEKISDSKLDWSFCASFRYMQFARFSEQASSLGHYGWLAGDQRYSQILTPGEKVHLTGQQRYKSIIT